MTLLLILVCVVLGVSKTYEAIDFPLTAVKILNDCTPVDKSIVLKVGAQIMLLKNISVAKGLVNGARGIVEKFVDGKRLETYRKENLIYSLYEKGSVTRA